MERYDSEFHSGFTRWIEQRMDPEDRDDSIEVFGVLARAYGLTEEVADVVAAMTGTTIGEVIAAYKADNTEWAERRQCSISPTWPHSRHTSTRSTTGTDAARRTAGFGVGWRARRSCPRTVPRRTDYQGPPRGRAPI